MVGDGSACIADPFQADLVDANISLQTVSLPHYEAS